MRTRGGGGEKVFRTIAGGSWLKRIKNANSRRAKKRQLHTHTHTTVKNTDKRKYVGSQAHTHTHTSTPIHLYRRETKLCTN